MTLTTISIILFVVCAVWFGLVYYAATVLPSKITTHKIKKEQNNIEEERTTILQKFFYL